MPRQFELNEIVWAKVSGFPWWPGFISSSLGDIRYEVNFLSDLSKANLSAEKIKEFDSHTVLSGKESRQLKASILTAQRILSNEISLLEAIQEIQRDLLGREKVRPKEGRSKKIAKRRQKKSRLTEGVQKSQ